MMARIDISIPCEYLQTTYRRHESSSVDCCCCCRHSIRHCKRREMTPCCCFTPANDQLNSIKFEKGKHSNAFQRADESIPRSPDQNASTRQKIRKSKNQPIISPDTSENKKPIRNKSLPQANYSKDIYTADAHRIERPKFNFRQLLRYYVPGNEVEFYKILIEKARLYLQTPLSTNDRRRIESIYFTSLELLAKAKHTSATLAKSELSQFNQNICTALANDFLRSDSNVLQVNANAFQIPEAETTRYSTIESFLRKDLSMPEKHQNNPVRNSKEAELFNQYLNLRQKEMTVSQLKKNIRKTLLMTRKDDIDTKMRRKLIKSYFEILEIISDVRSQKNEIKKKLLKLTEFESDFSDILSTQKSSSSSEYNSESGHQYIQDEFFLIPKIASENLHTRRKIEKYEESNIEKDENLSFNIEKNSSEQKSMARHSENPQVQLRKHDYTHSLDAMKQRKLFQRQQSFPGNSRESQSCITTTNKQKINSIGTSKDTNSSDVVTVIHHHDNRYDIGTNELQTGSESSLIESFDSQKINVSFESDEVLKTSGAVSSPSVRNESPEPFDNSPSVRNESPEPFDNSPSLRNESTTSFDNSPSLRNESSPSLNKKIVPLFGNEEEFLNKRKFTVNSVASSSASIFTPNDGKDFCDSGVLDDFSQSVTSRKSDEFNLFSFDTKSNLQTVYDSVLKKPFNKINSNADSVPMSDLNDFKSRDLMRNFQIECRMAHAQDDDFDKNKSAKMYGKASYESFESYEIENESIQTRVLEELRTTYLESVYSRDSIDELRYVFFENLCYEEKQLEQEMIDISAIERIGSSDNQESDELRETNFGTNSHKRFTDNSLSHFDINDYVNINCSGLADDLYKEFKFIFSIQRDLSNIPYTLSEGGELKGLQQTNNSFQYSDEFTINYFENEDSLEENRKFENIQIIAKDLIVRAVSVLNIKESNLNRSNSETKALEKQPVKVLSTLIDDQHKLYLYIYATKPTEGNKNYNNETGERTMVVEDKKRKNITDLETDKQVLNTHESSITTTEIDQLEAVTKETIIENMMANGGTPLFVLDPPKNEHGVTYVSGNITENKKIVENSDRTEVREMKINLEFESQNRQSKSCSRVSSETNIPSDEKKGYRYHANKRRMNKEGPNIEDALQTNAKKQLFPNKDKMNKLNCIKIEGQIEEEYLEIVDTKKEKITRKFDSDANSDNCDDEEFPFSNPSNRTETNFNNNVNPGEAKYCSGDVPIDRSVQNQNPGNKHYRVFNENDPVNFSDDSSLMSNSYGNLHIGDNTFHLKQGNVSSSSEKEKKKFILFDKKDKKKRDIYFENDCIETSSSDRESDFITRTNEQSQFGNHGYSQKTSNTELLDLMSKNKKSLNFRNHESFEKADVDESCSIDGELDDDCEDIERRQILDIAENIHDIIHSIMNITFDLEESVPKNNNDEIISCDDVVEKESTEADSIEVVKKEDIVDNLQNENIDTSKTKRKFLRTKSNKRVKKFKKTKSIDNSEYQAMSMLQDNATVGKSMIKTLQDKSTGGNLQEFDDQIVDHFEDDKEGKEDIVDGKEEQLTETVCVETLTNAAAHPTVSDGVIQLSENKQMFDVGASVIDALPNISSIYTGLYNTYNTRATTMNENVDLLKFGSHYSSYSNDDPPLLMDSGSGFIKVGLATDESPLVVPTVVGVPNYQKYMPVEKEKMLWFGNDAITNRGILKLDYPVKRGIIKNWDYMEQIWNYVFTDEVRVEILDHPMIVVESAFCPKNTRARTMELMMETYEVPAYYAAQQATMVLYSVGRTTGCVLNCGDSLTEATPVYDGYTLPHAAHKLDVGGRDVTEHLAKLLSQLGSSFKTTAEFDICREIKEKHCFVSKMQKQDELKEREDVDYKLPDGNIIALDAGRCSECSEILFDPSMVGCDSQGIHHMLYQSITSTDIDLRKELFHNIVVAGGSANLKGMEERLSEEIKSQTNVNMQTSVRVEAAPNKRFATWQGAKVLASLPYLNDMLISKDEYLEHGIDILFKKCF